MDARLIINNNPSIENKVTLLDITRMFYINDFDAFFDRNPAKQLAKALGLEHFEWLSYDYLRSDHQEDPNILEKKGIRYLKGLF